MGFEVTTGMHPSITGKMRLRLRHVARKRI